MHIREILAAKGGTIFSIGPDASLHEVAERLVEHNVGALLVMNPNHEGRASEMAGIITERDLLRAYATDYNALGTLRAADVMSAKVTTGSPNDLIEDVMGFMTGQRKRHLPIVADGRVVGMVSIGDVVKAQHDRLALENRFMKDYISS